MSRQRQQGNELYSYIITSWALPYFESGAVKASVSMAVRPPYKAEEPQWFDVEAWEAQAEVIANYVRKGTGLAVKGELVFDHWVDKNTGAP